MDGLRFEEPWALLLLAALPLIAAMVLSPMARGAAVRFGTIAPAAASPRTWRIRMERALPVLRLAAMVLLVLAIARPQRGEASAVVRGEGIDIVLGFDASSSMTQPYAGGQTRIDAAKSVLTGFVAARENDRVGLVVFQGSSITLSPLTTDYGALTDMIQTADRLRLADGTAIGTALGESVNILRSSSAASRIVILLTDGENNAGEVQPLAAARIAERLGIRVYTVGVIGGALLTPGSTAANVDEEVLESIASVTGGTYSGARDPQALEQVYQRIDELETSQFEGRDFARYAEMAPLFLAAAAIALAAELALRHTLLRRLA